MSDSFHSVLTSKAGKDYLPRQIKLGVRTQTMAVLHRIPHNSGKVDLALSIKRYNQIDGVAFQDDPKKSICLDDEELANLLLYLSENIAPFKAGLSQYIPIDIKKTNLNPADLADLVKNSTAEAIQNIVKISKISPQLDVLANTVKIEKQRQLIDEFEERLNRNIPEDSGDDSWQSWFTKNYWFLGPNYKKPIPKAKININGSKPDFLYPTVEGCADTIDIKLPGINNILIADPSHIGSFYWSTEIGKSLGQIVTYQYSLDENRLQLAELLGVTIVRPRGIIIAGRSNNWSSAQINGFRKLSYSLHGIEILTYDHILNRAKQVLQNLLET